MRRPLVIWVHFQIIPSQHDKSCSGKDFIGDGDLDSGILAFGVGRARSEKAAGDEFEYATFIAFEVAGVGGRVDRGMGFIVLTAISGLLKGTV